MAELTNKFLAYHQENPHIWEMFERFALQAIKSGQTRLSADLIIQRLRWETMLSAIKDNYKINDHYSADYARLFMEKHPQYNGFFALRCRTRKCHQVNVGEIAA